MTTERGAWELEEEEQAQPELQPEPQPEPKSIYELGHEPTTSVVLIDSDKHDYGEVRIVADFFDTGFKEGELIGGWTRVPYDNLIHMDLTTPLSALKDKGIQARSERAQKRAAKKDAKTPVAEDHSEVVAEFSSLRDKLARSRQ